MVVIKLRPLSAFRPHVNTVINHRKLLTVTVSWQIEIENMPRIFFSTRPISAFKPFGFNTVIEYTGLAVNTLSVNIAWGIATCADNDIAWKIKRSTEINSSWKINTSLSQITAWKILNKFLLEVNTSWFIKILNTSSIAWGIFTVNEQDSAWKIYITNEQNIAWKLFFLIEVGTSFQIFRDVVQDCSWLIKIEQMSQTSWGIYIISEKEIVWQVLLGLEQNISYRIQPAIMFDSSWKLKKEIFTEIAWAVKRTPNGSVSWKIIEHEGVIPGVDTHTISVTSNGTPIDPQSIVISADLQSTAWTINLVLATQAEYDLCVDGAILIITIDSMSWITIVKQQNNTRIFPNTNWSVSAFSKFTSVSEELVTLFLNIDTLVSDIASDIAGSIPINWNALNWKIPSNIRVAENNTRKSVLDALTTAIGAEIFSTPLGELKVIPGSPLNTNPIEIWTDVNVINSSMQLNKQEAYDRVLTGSAGLFLSRNISISVLEKDNVEREAIIGVRVFPEVIRPTVEHCGPSNISLIQKGAGAIIETETTLVAFIDGMATLSNVDTIVSVSWGSYTNLGTVTIVGNGILLSSVIGDSLAEIEYTAKYYEYILQASGSAEVTTMVCASVPPIRSDIIADCQRGTSTLAPDVLTSVFCTTIKAAGERGRVYLDKHDNDIIIYNITKVWDGSVLPELGAVISFNGVLTRVRSFNINYTFPAVSLSASLEVL